MLFLLVVYTGLYVALMLLRTRLGRAQEVLAEAEAAAEERQPPRAAALLKP
jgi:hypothetical protein